MSKATCPKCGAGRAALELVKEPTVIGFERFIKCNQCGNRIYEPPKTVMTRTYIRTKHKELLAPCKVEGCSVQINPSINRTGFCSRCRTRQTNAIKGGYLPFYVETADGKWIDNPERAAI
ncbi:hypothetical protein [uncultured Desulfuromonas sp.]|uniref:hypothetical protein n=1 Tax=uncultured Desulfuromonas sp. TaxID=181013 RepID=UPI002AABB83D|nr:hypothetical protein [uncultured Desulfuromonas sp.]